MHQAGRRNLRSGVRDPLNLDHRSTSPTWWSEAAEPSHVPRITHALRPVADQDAPGSHTTGVVLSAPGSVVLAGAPAHRGPDQVGTGCRLRNRARLRVNSCAQGQSRGPRSVGVPERLTRRPGDEMRAKLRATTSSRGGRGLPSVLVQRVRLWASTAQHGQATVGEEVPGGHMLEPRALLEVPNGELDLGVVAMEGVQRQASPSRSVRNAKGCQCGQSWAWAMSMRRVRRTMRRRPCGRRPSSLDRSFFR